jgi:glycosyltransferase involved in cell wall biosynthesis
MRRKLVYISSIAAPHQVKLSIALRQYLDVLFVFYEGLGHRAAWWKITLPDHCVTLPGKPFRVKGMRLTFRHLTILRREDPDIVMLGGFSAFSNIFAYYWAKWNKKKTVVLTERSRDKSGNLRSYGLYWRILRFLYRNVDLVMVLADDIVPQFRDTFRFGTKVVASRYAADIDAYFDHLERDFKPPFTFMFPNRLTEIYNPLGAIAVFVELLGVYPGSRLVMNAVGPLRSEAEANITAQSLQESVNFLDDIDSWDKLNLEYLACDVMLLPATFSNGNFTIIEAMASGMGVVISDKVLGVGKLIRNGENGYRIPPDKKAFVTAVRALLDNPRRTQRWAQANREEVRYLGAAGTAALYAGQLKALFIGGDFNAIKKVGGQ